MTMITVLAVPLSMRQKKITHAVAMSTPTTICHVGNPDMSKVGNSSALRASTEEEPPNHEKY